MITILSDVSDYMFSSALEEFAFSTNAEAATFSLQLGNTVLHRETYVPDAEGIIRIYDLPELVETHLTANLIEKFTYTITDGTDTRTRTFTVQFCAAAVSIPATEWREKYFLTTLQGAKTTAPGRKEFLHLIVTAATDVTVTAIFLSPTGMTEEAICEMDPVTETGRVATIDVSPDTFTHTQGWDLVAYTVEAGDRTQQFLVSEGLDSAPNLVFTNSFGCQETIYCTGTHALKPKYERSASVIGGKYRNYLIEETRTFDARTGPLSFEMARWAEDLFRSKEVYLLEQNTQGREVTVTEAKAERDNEPDTIPDFPFTYRYAQRNHNVIDLPRAGRIFDHTFDNTFN